MSVHDDAMRRLIESIDRPIIQNAIRSMYVEYQLAVLLGDAWTLVGTDWGGWDFEGPFGHRLEVKQAAARQSWPQTRPSKGVFDIAIRTGRYEGATWIDEAGRFAHLYVFAWHGLCNNSADQRDERQWTYFVVPTARLPAQKSISLTKLRHLVEPTDAQGLPGAVEAVVREMPGRNPF